MTNWSSSPTKEAAAASLIAPDTRWLLANPQGIRYRQTTKNGNQKQAMRTATALVLCSLSAIKFDTIIKSYHSNRLHLTHPVFRYVGRSSDNPSSVALAARALLAARVLLAARAMLAALRNARVLIRLRLGLARIRPQLGWHVGTGPTRAPRGTNQPVAGRQELASSRWQQPACAGTRGRRTPQRAVLANPGTRNGA